MDKDEALKLALEALEFYYDLYKEKGDANAITAIKAVLAQPEQEPVAWNVVDPTGKIVATEMNSVRGWARIEGYKPTVEGLLGFHEQGWRVVPTTPPRREWVGLTVKEIEWCFYDANDARIVAARSIEAKLKQKNGFAEEKNGG